MDDAAAVPRTVLHEMAVYELISLKDPLTLKLLTDYIGHDHPDCRKLAIAALAWMADSKIVPAILPYMFDKTPQGRENPIGVQEAAICAVCVLASDNDSVSLSMVANGSMSNRIPTANWVRFTTELRLTTNSSRSASRSPAPRQKTPTNGSL